jgi:hypothetical protein
MRSCPWLGCLVLWPIFPTCPSSSPSCLPTRLNSAYWICLRKLKHSSGADNRVTVKKGDAAWTCLAEGFIAVEMEPDVVEGKQMLRLMLSDSGKGFDGHGPEHAAAAADNVIAGHGLTLVRRLTARLSYGNRGSEVIALIGRDRTTNQSIPLLVSEGSESGA